MICKGVTKKGVSCRYKAKPGSEYCGIHTPREGLGVIRPHTPRMTQAECNCCMDNKSGVKKRCRTAKCNYSMCEECYSRLIPDTTGSILCPQCRVHMKSGPPSRPQTVTVPLLTIRPHGTTLQFTIGPDVFIDDNAPAFFENIDLYAYQYLSTIEF
jgi:hypothetical protein